MKHLSVAIISTVLLYACTAHHKKVIVYLKGATTVDEASKIITITDGSGSDEKLMSYNSGDKVTLKIKGLGNDTTASIDNDGLYVLNAKNDTLIGSYQQYNEPGKTIKVKSQEEIKRGIDSLIKLTENKNISAANRNFYVLPKTAVKISDNVDAFVVGPFHKMTSIEKEGDKVPEVYRFYSIKEIRETIAKATLLTIGEKK